MQAGVHHRLACTASPRHTSTEPALRYAYQATQAVQPLQHKQLNMESAGRQPVAYDLRRATYNHSRKQGVIAMQ